MITKNKYRNNLQHFESLLHNLSQWVKKTYKVWLCESLRKLKGVGQQSESKMNDFRIHIIADMQLHVRLHGMPKVKIRSFGQIFELALQSLLGNPLHISRITGNQKIRILKVWRYMDGETEVF